MHLDALLYANSKSMASSKRLTRAEKRASTRAALLESAANTFMRKGFEAVTVEGITEAAGFSRGAFYSNFGSKDELFLALIESRIQGSLADIAAAFQHGSTANERISSGGRFLEDLVAKDRQWCLLYMEFWSLAARDPKLRRQFAAHYELWRTGIAEMIGLQSRGLGIELDAPPGELASALIALFEGHVLQRLIDPKSFEQGFFTRLLLRFFSRVGSLARGPEQRCAESS